MPEYDKKGTRNSVGFRVPVFSFLSRGLKDDLVYAFRVADGFKMRGAVAADVNRLDPRFQNGYPSPCEFNEYAHLVFIARAVDPGEQRNKVV